MIDESLSFGQFSCITRTNLSSGAGSRFATSKEVRRSKYDVLSGVVLQYEVLSTRC
jgi:hypothetical protein